MRPTPTRFGPISRIGLVLFYALAAFVIAGRMGGTGEPAVVHGEAAPHARTPDSRTVSQIFVFLQASREINNWKVTLDGTALVPEEAGALQWSGGFEVIGGLQKRLVLDLTPSVFASEQPLAVRLELTLNGGTFSRSFWAPEDLIEAIDLADLTSQGKDRR